MSLSVEVCVCVVILDGVGEGVLGGLLWVLGDGGGGDVGGGTGGGSRNGGYNGGGQCQLKL